MIKLLSPSNIVRKGSEERTIEVIAHGKFVGFAALQVP
jgi:hypothetical protein